MGSTFLSLNYHIVFSTKHRAPLIDPAWQSDLYSYLGGTINGLGGFTLQIGGVADHVHLLVGLLSTHCLADVMRELKKSSSVWVRDVVGIYNFSWQEGYAAFTVSAPSQGSVMKYIMNQEVHHRRCSSRDELLALLRKAGLDDDPKYLE